MSHKYRRILKPCIVCGTKTRDRIWVYSGNTCPPICSERCFKEACAVFRPKGIMPDQLRSLEITDEDIK